VATQTSQERQRVPEPAPLRAVGAPAAQECGDCVYHIPHATRRGGWCACRDAKLRWQPVDAGGPVCAGFTLWPKGSPVPAFLSSMRF
jgi:hypothetical protein